MKKYTDLTDEELKIKLEASKRLKELFGFNNSIARRRAEVDYCFLKAEIERRNEPQEKI